MQKFHWNQWVSLFVSAKGRKRRHPQISRVEGLEDRALLTANLPVAVNDVYSVDQNTTLNATTSVLANDTDADGDTIGAAVLQNNVLHGSLTLNANGTFTYAPTAGFSGTDSFTYSAKDVMHNELSASPATVTLNVTTNAAPTVSAVTLSTTTNTAVSGTLSGVDANGDTLTFTEGSTPETHGTVVINPNGTFTFTPAAGFTGVATFSYKANDGSLNSNVATVTVNVGSSTNTVPVVINGNGTSSVDAALNGTLTSLATDAEGDTLTFAVASQPAHGTVIVNSNGTFTFTPDSGFTGPTSFTFTASDGSLTSTPATFTILVSNQTQGSFDLDLNPSVAISSNPSSPTPLDSGATLTNVAAGTNFANAELDVKFISGSDSKKDRLVVIKHGGSVEVKGKKILVDGTQVATITSGGKKGSDLHVKFNSNATAASINAVLQRVAIQTRPSASGGARVIQFKVTADGSTATDTIQASLTGSGNGHSHG